MYNKTYQVPVIKWAPLPHDVYQPKPMSLIKSKDRKTRTKSEH